MGTKGKACDSSLHAAQKLMQQNQWGPVEAALRCKLQVHCWVTETLATCQQLTALGMFACIATFQLLHAAHKIN